tara:strand:- start:1199 stop:3784 length:2586 start_codon:yes stop_codon:yes gene_type:complete
MTEKKQPLITSDRVYYKIKWHEKADQKKALIKYINYGELKTVSYHDWIPIKEGGEIPWTRVHIFTYSGKILWDRENRAYNPEILDIIEYYSNISVIKFIDKDWKQIDNKKYDVIPDNIKIISFNCLIDKYDKKVTNLEPRLPVILEYLIQYNVDVICLQEITIRFKKKIMEDKFIRDNYYITNNEPKIFGQLILSKFCPTYQNLVTLDGNHMKKYLQMSFLNKFEEIIEIYNIHLTSNQQSNSDKKREDQLNQLFEEIKEEKVIIAGDFNDDEKMEYNEFKDTWEILKGDEEGFTFDYIDNNLTSKTTKSFIRTRIDKILYKNLKPNNIDLCFNKSINNIWASDHFGLISEFNIIETKEENFIKKNLQIKTGTILCLILEPRYWSMLNKIRSKYDDGYNKIAPHVTLFQKFVSIDDFESIKDDIKPINEHIIFDKVEIFNLTNKFAVVLTTMEENKINSIRKNLENKLDLKIDSRPHITLAIIDDEKKANTIKIQICTNILDKHKIKVSLKNITFMKKMGDQYQVYENIGKIDNIDPKDLLLSIIDNFAKIDELHLIGSRAYGIQNSDYDFVLFGNIDENDFGNKFVSLAKMSQYFCYAKYVLSKITSVNLITSNKEEINLIYQKKENKSPFVLNSIESIKIIHEMVKDNYILFIECYRLVRIWAKNRSIYGSKYGYFNGVTWLILTLNIFKYFEIKGKKMFIRKFFKFYNEYDWSEPINIRNLPAKKETKCDEMIFIQNVTENDKLVRTLSQSTWKIIKNEFRRTQEIDDLNIIFEKKKITSKYVKITINDNFRFNRYEKQNQLTSEMWKLCLKTQDIEPYIDWIEKDNKLIYKFGISSNSDSDVIYGYFRKYLCMIEFI